jgi:RHS repeat-associated protein
VTELGEEIGWEEYHPYGTTALSSFDATREVSAKRYRYTGMERDDETGLAYHSARYYAPWLGRWVSADPIGVRGGLNLLEYARGQPTVSADESGLAPPTPPTEDHGSVSLTDPLTIGQLEAARVGVGMSTTVADSHSPRLHEFSVGESTLLVFRPSQSNIVDARGLISMDAALDGSVSADGGADVAINGQFQYGPQSFPLPVPSTVRGSTAMGNTIVDPLGPGEAPQEGWFTLEGVLSAGGTQRLEVYAGDVRPNVPGRQFAIGGLEVTALAGQVLALSDARRSPTTRNSELSADPGHNAVLGKTLLAIDAETGAVAVFSQQQGRSGATTQTITETLVAAGFSTVVVLDGSTSSHLSTRRGLVSGRLARMTDTKAMALVFGLAFQVAR